MKLHRLLHHRRTLAAVFALAIAAGLLARADSWDRKTVLTVNEPIQVRDTVLDPGQYVLKLYDSQSDRHIVQIFNADQSRIIDTIIAIPKERMEPAGKSVFTFWETPTGTPPAMRDWFYPGDTIGQEFPYPSHLKELAVLTPPTSPVTPAPAPVTESATTMKDQPTQASDIEEPEIEPQKPVEVAQNTEPPAQAPVATPEPAPAPAPAQPEELPKTASPYPLIGLCGLAALGISALLRPRRAC